MKLGTANIKNYPDMTEKQVRADAKEIASYVTIWGGQEITPKEDSLPILQAMNEAGAKYGHFWNIIGGKSETPLFYRSDLWKPSLKRVKYLPNRMDFKLTPKNSAITSALFTSIKQPGVPPFAVVNCHLITDGRHGEGGMEKRLIQWDIEYDMWAEGVKYYVDKGVKFVFPMGDTNNADTAFPSPRGQWIIGATAIDKIGVRRKRTSTGTANAHVNNSARVEINSDHDLLFVDMDLR